jgi:hypothetical protein
MYFSDFSLKKKEKKDLGLESRENFIKSYLSKEKINIFLR